MYISYPSSVEELLDKARIHHDEYKALSSKFYGSFGKIIFKGSKAQKKNALKQLLKKKAAKEAAWEEYFQAKKDFLKERLSSIERSLESNISKFWWEVLPLNHFDRLREEKEEIILLLKRMES